MKLFPTLALLVLAPSVALAHPGHGEAVGLAAGIAHPLGGLDHAVAMVAVGLIAALRGGRALWIVPLAFLAMMSAGAALGMAGAALPLSEDGIAVSLVVFGLLCLAGRTVPLGGLVALTGAFAIFHGYAHGAEMPETASGLRFGLGFLLGTAALHAAGLGLGAVLARIFHGRTASAASPILEA